MKTVLLSLVAVATLSSFQSEKEEITKIIELNNFMVLEGSTSESQVIACEVSDPRLYNLEIDLDTYVFCVNPFDDLDFWDLDRSSIDFDFDYSDILLVSYRSFDDITSIEMNDKNLALVIEGQKRDFSTPIIQQYK